MRSYQILPALLALAAAAPAPQGINYGEVDDELPEIPDLETVAPVTAPPTIITFDPAGAIESVKAEATNSGLLKRSGELVQRHYDNSGCGACEVQPTIPNFYNVQTIYPEHFVADETIASVANNAATPSGYTQVFKNLKASSNGYVYMGYEVLSNGPDAYNPAVCAAKCSSIAGCQSFNIFFERNPTVDACSDTCQDPAAFANIKCSYWGGPITAASAQNEGQWRNKFHVVIAGSNGYVNPTVASSPGYSTPEFLGEASINAPRDCQNTDTYMGYKLFENTPFDTALCAAACSAQTAYNVAHPPQTGAVRKCNYWNTYLLNKNGIAQGQFCAMYTEKWAASYATNVGQWRGSDHYTISASYTGYNTTYVPSCAPA